MAGRALKQTGSRSIEAALEYISKMGYLDPRNEQIVRVIKQTSPGELRPAALWVVDKHNSICSKGGPVWPQSARYLLAVCLTALTSEVGLPCSAFGPCEGRRQVADHGTYLGPEITCGTFQGVAVIYMFCSMKIEEFTGY